MQKALAIPTANAVDMVATDDEQLHGRAVDSQGQARVAVQVQLVERDRVVVASARTDQPGYFTLTHATPGLKFAESEGQQPMVRIWHAQTAPPQSHHGLLLVTDVETVRAQCLPPPTLPAGNRPYTGQQILYRILQRPWLVAAGTAAAIAIPIAVNVDNEGRRFESQFTSAPDAS